MKFVFFILFAFPVFIFSQDEKQAREFDSIFYDIAVNVTSSNPSKATHLADSLFLHSRNEKQKIKSLMLIADILEKQEKRGEAIIYALKSLEVAKNEKDYTFQARIYGFLSTQYRTIGFMDKGKSFLNKGLEASNHIPNKRQVEKYLAMMHEENAEYALEALDYDKAIEHLDLAIQLYENEENPQFKNFVLANAQEMLGRSYMALNKPELALEHFSEANVFINNADAGNTLWASLIYNGIGKTFLNLKKTDSAEVYLKKAFTISDKSKHGSLKENVYKSLASYYKQIKEQDSFNLYDSKYNDILKENSAKKKLMVNSAYKILNDQPNKTSNNKYYLIIAGLLLLLVFSGWFYKRKNILSKNEVVSKVAGKKSMEIVLSQTTEDELLLKLKEFEASTYFLDPNMSLSRLIDYLETNVKYLRQILKTYKNTDYTTYINELRINYIVEKLKTDPEFLNYKISYLADKCGFSSHSKFSANFKRVTDLSPSEFINNINKDINRT
ncbi:helix-turn-helix domain-containing protein [Xanthomarina sp.]|uniref:helix-turn-helix domain-containing protein n=1 Tax=Xanthomarina sp. TaxID=1931211 RepID=UPI002C19971B|nr:helix-turn-helix domain-containing protein [Xanthomarina sp.]HLV38435.1 helix-turn-helix domain-containing protein [Xanthomarina sp.]